MAMRDHLKIDLLTYAGNLGLPQVLQVAAEVCEDEAARSYFADWQRDWQRVAETIKQLADRAREFEAHYGARCPEQESEEP